MSEVQEFLANVQDEGESVDLSETQTFKEDNVTDKEQSDSSPEEKNQEETNPSQEGEEGDKPDNTPAEEQLPFHKHPRWKAMNDENQTLKQQVGDMAQKFEELSSSIQNAQGAKGADIPQWFVNALGDDPNVWQAFKDYEDGRISDMKQELVSTIQQQKKAEEEETQKWNSWVNDSLTNLEADGKKFDRNELLKVALDFKPTDDKGNIDFNKAYQIMETMNAGKQQEKSEKSDVKKNLVNTGKTKNIAKPDGYTSSDLKNLDWADIANNN